MTQNRYLSGTPQITIGDDLVLFVKANGASPLPFVGADSGVVKIEKRGNVASTLNDSIVAGRPTINLTSSSSKDAVLISSTSRIDEMNENYIYDSDHSKPLSKLELIKLMINIRRDSGIREKHRPEEITKILPKSDMYFGEGE